MTQRETELEHELAAALRKIDDECGLLQLCKQENEEKRQDIVYLATEKAKLENRIDRLEEESQQLEKDSKRLAWLLEKGLAWRGCYNDYWIEGEWLYSSQYAIATIDKAREAKP